MQLRYRYRLYPTEQQRQALAQAFGNARVVYNDAVRARQDAYQAGEKFPTGTQLQKQLITNAKRTDERGWLAECSNIVLQQAIRDADAAYTNFFNSMKGKRAGRRMGAPRFKSKRDQRQVIRLHTGGFRIRENGRLNLAKVGDVRVAWSRDLPSAPTSVTIIKTACGRYFASFVVETDPDGHGEHLDPVVDDTGEEAELALDLGLNAFATDQHGHTITNPRVLRRAERRLKKAQRALSRKQRGSTNRAKAGARVARLHAKVADTRADWLHKVTTDVVRENQTIYVEDLSVKGLSRTRMAKSVHDASWGRFLALLEYKAARYGRTLVRIDRFHPSTKLCSSCGAVQDMPLSERVYRCPCGLVLDRDRNAALNILAAGRVERLNACGADIRPATRAVGVEAGSSGIPRGNTASAA
ncbi:putative transposase [Haloactinospora alba]|uniref:Putative transposase n=1 Tax=Haloactinospora alba TaxID=405555 RepID=A0A543N9H7_9ACTN|nr:RNA-guided endonuclease TnpB family protein [Haloactinospora alba]TQN28468.1 putative transposase [Haloactinospora alba]TQN33492.1 putative transposase [Haloactinospora alba]